MSLFLILIKRVSGKKFPSVIISSLFVFLLTSCRTLSFHFGDYFFPENMVEQLQTYLGKEDSRYLVLPVYADDTYRECKLILDTPYFVSNFNEIPKQFHKNLRRAVQHQLTFFILGETGEMTAIEIPYLPVINDYSLRVYRGKLSQEWKKEILHVIEDGKMLIYHDSWMCTSSYQYYSSGSFLYFSHKKPLCKSMSRFISDMPFYDFKSSIWKRCFIPVGKKHAYFPYSMKNEEMMVFDVLPIFDEHYDGIYKINGRLITGKHWFTGKISSKIRQEIEKEKPKVIIYRNLDPYSFRCNEYDSLRNYSKKGLIHFFYFDLETESFFQVFSPHDSSSPK